ncbi:MAG: PH domain-containing protein [Actinomycetes bacterium]
MARRTAEQDDEDVVVRTRPHARVLTVPVLVLHVALALAGFAAARVPAGDWQRPGRALVAAVTLAVVVRWAALPYLRWLGTVLEVTDRRVVVEQGLLRRSTRSLPLSRVADVSVERSLGQRLVGSGTVVLDTVGERGGVVVRDVPHATRVARLVEDLLDELPPTWQHGRDDGWDDGRDHGWDEDER